MLPQTILTLNLLRQLNVAPNISAYAYHHGTFDNNRMPIAPMGCSVQFHGKNDWQTQFFSSTSISHNPRSRQWTPLSMHLRNCGMPFRGFNTPKTMPTSKLFDALNKRFSLKTNRPSRWGNGQTSKGGTSNRTYPASSKGALQRIPTHGSRPTTTIDCCVTAEALR